MRFTVFLTAFGLAAAIAATPAWPQAQRYDCPEVSTEVPANLPKDSAWKFYTTTIAQIKETKVVSQGYDTPQLVCVYQTDRFGDFTATQPKPANAACTPDSEGFSCSQALTAQPQSQSLPSFRIGPFEIRPATE